MSGEQDPRVLVIAEMRKQTGLLTLMQANLTAMAGTLLDMADRQAGQSSAPATPRIDLDGPHGNPAVKMKDPRDWSGDPQGGKLFSECPPDYLDLMADRYDYFATKADQTPEKVRYAKLDAARARGWAARLRSGWKPAVPASMGTTTDENGDYVTDDFAAGAEPKW